MVVRFGRPLTAVLAGAVAQGTSGGPRPSYPSGWPSGRGDAVQERTDLGHRDVGLGQVGHADDVDAVGALLVGVEPLGPLRVVVLVGHRDQYEHVVGAGEQALGLGAVVGHEVRDQDDDVRTVGLGGGPDGDLDAVVEVLVVRDDRDVAVRVDARVRGPRRLDGGLDRPVQQLVQHGLDAAVGGEDRDVDLDLGTHRGDLQILARRP